MTEEKKVGLLSSIASALSLGNITSAQAQQMRNQMGIFKSNFTRKQSSADKKKARRKMASKSRKANLKRGFKGQKINSGKHKR